MPKILNNNILLLAKSQEFKEVLINEIARALSVLRRSVQSRTITSPPTNPNVDDFYIVPASATGAWSGKTNKIAYPVIDVNGAVVSGQWNFYEPMGTVFSLSDIAFLRWNGTAWVSVAGSGDMLKAVYDTAGIDGVVDLAEKIYGIDTAPDNIVYGKFSAVTGFFNLATRIFQSLFNLNDLSTFQAGDLIYYDGSKFVRLPKSGDTSKFLNGNLAFTTPGSANPDVMPVTIPTPEVGIIPLVSFPYNRSINSIIQRQTASGTVTFDLRIDSTNITGISSITASSTSGNNTATANKTMTANTSVLRLNITSVSSATMLFFVIVFD